MAISFTCSECDRDIKVKDALAGRKIKCPGCQASVIVPNPDEKTAVTTSPRKSNRGDEIQERPRKKASPPDDEPDEDEEQPRKKDKKKKKKKSNTGLIIAAAGGAVVLLIGVVVGVIFLLPPKQEPPKAPPKVVAQAPPEDPKEPEKIDLNKVDIGKGKRQVTSIRARIDRPARLNDLKQLATFYQTFRADRGKPPQKAEEFIKYIERDSPPLKKAVEERYYVVVSKVESGIVAYEHDPDNSGQHGTVDLSTAVTDITTDELVTQLKKQGSWSDDGNRPRK